MTLVTPEPWLLVTVAVIGLVVLGGLLWLGYRTIRKDR